MRSMGFSVTHVFFQRRIEKKNNNTTVFDHLGRLCARKTTSGRNANSSPLYYVEQSMGTRSIRHRTISYLGHLALSLRHQLNGMFVTGRCRHRSGSESQPLFAQTHINTWAAELRVRLPCLLKSVLAGAARDNLCRAAAASAAVNSSSSSSRGDGRKAARDGDIDRNSSSIRQTVTRRILPLNQSTVDDIEICSVRLFSCWCSLPALYSIGLKMCCFG